MRRCVFLDRDGVINFKQTYGQFGSTFVDRLRIYLVGLTIKRYMPKRSELEVLDLGCGYHASYLRAMHSRLRSGTGIDYRVSEEVRQLPRLRFIEDSIETALYRLRVAPILGRQSRCISNT